MHDRNLQNAFHNLELEHKQALQQLQHNFSQQETQIRDKYKADIQCLNNLIAEKTHEINTSDSRYKQLQQQQQQLQRKYDDLQQTNQHLENEQQLLQEKFHTLKRDIEANVQKDVNKNHHHQVLCCR